MKGEKLKSEKFNVTLQKNNQVFYQNEHFSDENGLVKFKFEPTDCTNALCFNETFDKTSVIDITIVS